MHHHSAFATLIVLSVSLFVGTGCVASVDATDPDAQSTADDSADLTAPVGEQRLGILEAEQVGKGFGGVGDQSGPPVDTYPSGPGYGQGPEFGGYPGYANVPDWCNRPGFGSYPGCSGMPGFGGLPGYGNMPGQGYGPGYGNMPGQGYGPGYGNVPGQGYGPGYPGGIPYGQGTVKLGGY